MLLILFTAAQDNRASTFTLNLAVALPGCVKPLDTNYQSPALTKRLQLWIIVVCPPPPQASPFSKGKWKHPLKKPICLKPLTKLNLSLSGRGLKNLRCFLAKARHRGCSREFAGCVSGSRCPLLASFRNMIRYASWWLRSLQFAHCLSCAAWNSP